MLPILRFTQLKVGNDSSSSIFLQDSDKPLTYEFNYKTDSGLYTVVSYGSEDHVTTVLPSGNKDSDYKIDFEITVTDSLSAATKVLRKVKASTYVC